MAAHCGSHCDRGTAKLRPEASNFHEFRDCNYKESRISYSGSETEELTGKKLLSDEREGKGREGIIQGGFKLSTNSETRNPTEEFEQESGDEGSEKGRNRKES